MFASLDTYAPAMPPRHIPSTHVAPDELLYVPVDPALPPIKHGTDDSAMLGDSGYARNARDFYSTPEECTEVLIDALEAQEILLPDDVVWEPACGDWRIGRVFEGRGYAVVGSDIEPLDARGIKADFLLHTIKKHFDVIVTNPPFGVVGGASIDDFMERGLHHVRTRRAGVSAMLGRKEIDSATGRQHLFKHCPEFYAKLDLLWRPRWIAGSTGSPRHNYSWYIWANKEAVASNGGALALYAPRPKS